MFEEDTARYLSEERRFQATCIKCHTEWPLKELAALGVDLEPGTSVYEEDTITFRCPVCHAKQTALVCLA
jgi:Zn finger protein HypA/HybF involved in hydrogenase expression